MTTSIKDTPMDIVCGLSTFLPDLINEHIDFDDADRDDLLILTGEIHVAHSLLHLDLLDVSNDIVADTLQTIAEWLVRNEDLIETAGMWETPDRLCDAYTRTMS